MYFVTIYLQAGREIGDLSVDTHFGITLLAHLLEELTVVSLTSTYQWGQNRYLPIFEVGENLIEDLFLSIADHFLTRLVAVRFANTGVEQAEKIVDLRYGTYGRARIAASCFLLDADNGTQTRDLFHLRPFHLTNKLAGVGGEGFHIATLSFGVDRIKC